jgi:hypothetical protein
MLSKVETPNIASVELSLNGYPAGIISIADPEVSRGSAYNKLANL